MKTDELNRLVELADIKWQLATQLIGVFAIFALISLPVSLSRWVEIGFQPIFVMHFALAFAVFALWALRKHLTPETLLTAMVVILTLSSTVGILNFGLQSGLVAQSIFTIFLIGLIWGVKASIFYLVAWNIALFVTGYSFSSGKLQYAVDPGLYSVSMFGWTNIIFGNLMTSGLILITAIIFYQSTKRMVRIIDKQNTELKHLASQDSLTGLLNIRECEAQFDQLAASAARSQQMMAVIFIDLDKFKLINDTHGHHVGDIVLKHVADRINRTIRDSDIACRAGGDEFIVILTNVKTKVEIERGAKRLEAAIKTQIEQEDIKPELSLGVAVFPEDGSQLKDLKMVADQKMYDNKFRNR